MDGGKWIQKMTFSPDIYRRAVANYDRTWRATDETLYDLCRRHPGHSAIAGVNAKLWIIGRTYATGIERKIRSKRTQGSSMSQLGQYMLARTAELDAIFGPLTDIAEPITPDKLRTIIGLHGRFVRLLQPLTRNAQSTRSFCSKYMHFHCPAVPIIDTYAERALRKAVRWQRSFRLFDLPAGADEQYARYVLRFWQLYQQALAAGLQPTVKHLDYYLLCAAEGEA